MTTSRLSYASSPESDLELSPGPSASLSLGNLPQLVKSSSDPSIATNQDNLDRDRELNIGEGMPPPYTNPYEHATSHARRSTIDSKYGFAANGSGTVLPGDLNGPTYSTANRPPPPIHGQNQSIFGTDLPPRVDRASKPPGLNPLGQPINSPQSRGSGGTIGRSAQERLFGAKITENPEQENEYATKNNYDKQQQRGSGNSMDRNQSSLDRQRGGNIIKNNNGSYDSVSSYDSYNNTTQNNVRLGPNAPDDLKSVPNTNGRTPTSPNQGVPMDYRNSNINDPRNNVHNHTDSTIINRPSIMHEHSRSLSSGANDLNRQNSPGRPGDRNIGMSPQDQMMRPPGGINIPQRPTNLGLDGSRSPRKHVVETKTDYGKYSRNNSATQADYKTPPAIKTQQQQIIGPPSGTPFKPVPPPKPKNYRPPIQGSSNGGNGQMNSGQWGDNNGEPKSPRSPNGFFYPSTPSHYHHSAHNTPTSPKSGHRGGGGPPPQMHHYSHQYGGGGGGNGGGNGNYSTAQQMQYNNREQITNGYNGSGGNNNHPYTGQYMHRSPANISHHPPDRHSLDLAGSREQRGSAFELYRKPQIGTVHHNISRMEPPPPHSYHTHSSSSSAVISNELNERQQYNCELSVSPPPPQPPPKTKKKLLKSPLAAIKNAFIRSTRPLRRQSSMIESDKKIRPNLRRQHSLMEHQRPSNNNRMIEMNPNINYDDQRHYIYSSGPQYPLRHEPFYPNDGNSTYQNLETESIYGYTNGPVYYDQQQQQQQQQQHQQEHLYSNRALIELERGRQYNETKYKGGGGRIVRRHSLAERSTSFYPSKYPIQQYHHDVIESVDEPIYQTRNGSYMMENVRERNEDYLSYQNRRSESIYQNRREMHRDHLYQSRSEMQERINIGKREVGLVAMDSPTLTTRNHNDDRRILKDPVYQSRRELKENGFKTRTQLRDHIYQSRREAMESMAEPIYVSKREIKHEPIYETKESDMAEVASAIEKLDLSLRQEPSGQEQEQNDVQTNLEKYQITEVNEENDDDDDTLTNNKSDLQKSTTTAGTPGGDTVIMPPPDEIIDHNNVKAIATLSPRSLRSLPYHISNVIKRTACPPSPKINDKYASRTSVETHYQSQTSIPIGPPNAQSTPYQSEMSIGYGGNNLPPPRQPTITRGIFTDKGGTLCDPIWNVSLIIPEGAIPKDVQQEIHFKISDPRLSEEFFGPPLDMENGEKMLSPLVMCGPQGLEFLLPVILNIPHCASRTPSLGLSVKATDSEKNLKTDWDNVELPSNIAEHTVSVKVDHF